MTLYWLTTNMNNTKTLAIVAIFMAATLVVGTLASTATTQTALAYQKKNRGGSQENSKNGNTVTIQAEKQKASVSGFDNTLEQEAQNVICTHPSSTCVSEGSETDTTDTTDNGDDGHGDDQRRVEPVDEENPGTATLGAGGYGNP